MIVFPANKFNFLAPKLSNYSFILLGNNLSKDNIEKALIQIDADNEIGGASGFFDAHKIVSIGLVKDENVTNFNQEIFLLKKKIEFNKTHFVILINHEEVIKTKASSFNPSEESFLISPRCFVDFFKKDLDTGLCYHMTLKALNYRNGVEQLLVHQVGHPNPIVVQKSENASSAEVVIPHKGELEDLEDLRSSLWHLKNQNISAEKISVCFDEFVSNHHFQLADENQEVRFFVNYPSGVGPYPSREKLSRSTEEDIIIYQDSDDVSTMDRISTLTSVLKDDNIDVLGSHELRVNKILKKIEAIRFPLDVINVENKVHRHPVFFPTTAIKKSAYLKTGGLSTIRKHSSDSQFFWKAHFFTNIRNVDEFLYIRVKRENSLTTASNTALGTVVRKRLSAQWRIDYLKIINRNISLLESSLVDEYNVVDIDLISLEAKNRGLIIEWQNLHAKLKDNRAFKNIETPSFPKEEDIIKDRILDLKDVKEPGVAALKKSISWRIGWAITRVIIFLFGWIPFVKKRL